jgi:DNA repair exonuclease SbcCD nuclease subunit
MRWLTEQAFERFVSEGIDARVDFAIIAGDLFNTAIPGIDTLKFTVMQLSRFREADIPVYAIPGSHDFSPSGKTMLDVLEEAGLLRNVCRGAVTPEGKLRLAFTVDKSGAKLTGVIGRRGMLDRQIYEELDHTIGQEPGEKIFLFHTALTELKPANLTEMESAPISFLPQGFTYYAGGHVHIVERYDTKGNNNVVYPGPLFPNSFSELEHLRAGGYYIYDNGQLIRREIALREVIPISFSVEGMDSKVANAQLQGIAQEAQVTGAIVLLRIEGSLSAGNPIDIDLRGLVHILESRGAYIVLRNTSKLTSPEFTALQLKAEEPHNIEESLLQEHAEQLKLPGASAQDGISLTRDMLRVLSREPHEGEKVYEYQERLVKDALELMDRRRDGKNGA